VTADDQTYAFDNALAVQRERLDTLEELFDPGTIRQLDARGVAPGWRCLEVGAGGGSVAAWLGDRVAPDGSVLATDLDTKWVAELSHPNHRPRPHVPDRGRRRPRPLRRPPPDRGVTTHDGHLGPTIRLTRSGSRPRSGGVEHLRSFVSVPGT
jgi:hypothetical protein